MAVVVALLVMAPAAFADTTLTYTPADATPGQEHGSNLTIQDDEINGAANDVITVEQFGSSYRVTRTGGFTTVTGCSGTLTVATCPIADGIAADLAGGNDVFTGTGVNTPMQLAGGAGSDRLTAGNGSDVLAGGDGDDTIVGNGGIDEFFGEGGNDTINSRDTVPERIACGNGNDQVNNDFTDIIAECERGTDNDHDGFAASIDCNDANSAIHPGAPEIFENGIDENCNGVDDRNLDRDGDGFPVPGDCNDANPAIHPGAIEIRGNTVDENCDLRAEPFATLPSLVSATWRLDGNNTKLRKLVVRNAPKGTQIVLTCKGRGCTFKRAKRLTVKRDLDPVGLDRFFGGSKTLRPGASVKVVVTAAQAVGRTYAWKIKKAEVPASSVECIAPGATKGKPC